MNDALVLLGSGGHARVVCEALRSTQDWKLQGVVSPDALPSWLIANTLRHWLKDNEFLAAEEPVVMLNGLGHVGHKNLRARLFEQYKQHDYGFMEVIHHRAVVASSVKRGEGVQIMAGAIAQAGAFLDDNVVINSGACVEHDVSLAAHVFVASNATLCGGVSVARESFIGAGATVIQQVEIGQNSLVAAGAVVTDNVPDNSMVAGVPAKVVEKL